jgi:uncharacterized protein with FMN-binding domain
MKRAILVSSGTLAGLVAVLTYSGADINPVTTAAGAGGGSGLALGAPPADGTGTGSDPAAGQDGATGDSGATGATGSDGAASPSASPSASASAAPTKAAAAPTKAAVKTTTAAKPTATKPVAAPTKAAVPAPKPSPKPTVAVAVAKDYVGSLQTHKYGKVQVGIRVKAGKIIAVWPVVVPSGDSQPYSDFSIPVLKSETMKAQGAGIANVSGATLTWQSWKKSLQSAMAKAGI